MISLNQSTIMSAVTSILMLVGMYLVASGKLTSDQWTAQSRDIVTAIGSLITVGIGIWKLIPHSDVNKVVAAKAVDGVSIVVAPTAPAPLVAMANDPTVPNINLKANP